MAVPRENILAIKVIKNDEKNNGILMDAIKKGPCKGYRVTDELKGCKVAFLLQYDSKADKHKHITELLKVIGENQLTGISQEFYERKKNLDWNTFKIK